MLYRELCSHDRVDRLRPLATLTRRADRWGEPSGLPVVCDAIPQRNARWASVRGILDPDAGCEFGRGAGSMSGAVSRCSWVPLSTSSTAASVSGALPPSQPSIFTWRSSPLQPGYRFLVSGYKPNRERGVLEQGVRKVRERRRFGRRYCAHHVREL